MGFRNQGLGSGGFTLNPQPFKVPGVQDVWLRLWGGFVD